MSKLRKVIEANPNRGQKIRVLTLCLLAALTFWLLNAMNESYTTTIKYPVQFLYDTERYIAVDELPDEIQINVNGLGWNLLRNSIGVRVTPVMFNLEAPTEVKRLSSSGMIGAVTDQVDEFQVNFILTDTVYLNIDRRATQRYKLAIDSAAIDIAESHWIVSDVTHTPDSITLAGPEGILQSLGDSIFLRVPQENIEENYNEDISIEVPRVDIVRREPPTLRVSFSVEEFTEATAEVQLELRNFPEDSSIYPIDHHANVAYLVTIGNAPLIKSDSFKVALDLNNINQEDSTIIPVLESSPALVKEVTLDTTGLKVFYND